MMRQLYSFILLLTIAFSLSCPDAVQAQADYKKEPPPAADSDDEAARGSLPTPDEAKLDDFGERVNSGIDDLGERVSSFMDKKILDYFGAWVHTKASYGLTWLALLASALLLLTVFVLERLLRMLSRKIQKKMSAEGQAVSLLELFLAALARPLSLFIWAYGLYLALTPLFDYFAGPNGTNLVQDIARRVTNFSASMVPFWFVFRFIGLLDDALSKKAHKTAQITDRVLADLIRSWRSPLRIFFLLLWMRIIVPLFGGSGILAVLVNYGFALALIGCIAWLVIRTTDILEDLLLSRFRIDVKDNLEARKIHTQIRFLKKLIVTTVFVLAIASMLMLFKQVRQFGASILASAGVVGIVAGLAAQRSIANLLVGIQVAITQPIRVDDVVIVENEWGQIEEITSTYVVVKIWDLRRLILPITYFTEKPFQNWTRISANLLGTVFLYVDYSIPVEEVRQALHRILQESKLWDRQAWALQVTDATAHTIELRALMSAANASAAWNLRCEVREKLITFIQENFPDSLPRIRAEMSNTQGEKPDFIPMPKTSKEG